MDFSNCSGTPQYCLMSGNISPYTAGILTNTLLHTMACKKAPMKSNCLTLTFSRAAWAKNIFMALMDAVGVYLSSVISLFWRSPLTVILVFNLSKVPSLLNFILYVSIVGTQ